MKGLLSWFKTLLGERILAIVLNSLLTKENIVKSADTLLDFLEDLAAKTDTKVDDAAVKAIREALQIPDLPDSK